MSHQYSVSHFVSSVPEALHFYFTQTQANNFILNHPYQYKSLPNRNVDRSLYARESRDSPNASLLVERSLTFLQGLASKPLYIMRKGLQVNPGKYAVSSVYKGASWEALCCASSVLYLFLCNVCREFDNSVGEAIPSLLTPQGVLFSFCFIFQFILSIRLGITDLARILCWFLQIRWQAQLD